MKLTNSGEREGDEIVQLYLTAHCSSISRPYRELKAFQRVRLKAGESTTLQFKLASHELGIYGADLKWKVEPGRFTVALGGSLDSLLETIFEVVK